MTEDEQQKTGNNIPRLRTFETDISDYVKKKGLSLADMASDQAKFKGLELQEGAQEGLFSRKTTILLVVVLILLGGGFSFLFFNKGDKTNPTFLEEPILTPDEKIEIIIDSNERPKFLKEVEAALGSRGGLNKLVNVLLLEKSSNGSKKSITARKFFELVKIEPPRELLDSFDDKKFMLSKIYLSNNWPILIFKLSSYNYAFSGMFKWENAIINDLSDIFPDISTNQTENLFLDQTIQNHNVRILKNTESKVVLAYSFLNRDYLVITSDIEPLQEIFRRFVSQ